MLLSELKDTIHLSEAQHYVITYMLDHQDDVAKMNLAQIANETYTSPATLVRLAKKFQFNGFIEFRDALLEELTYLNRNVEDIDANQPFTSHDSLMSIAHKIGKLEQETIDDTLSLLNHDTLRKAVRIMEKAKTIYLCGVSFNHALGEMFAMKMMRIGKPVVLCAYEEDYLYSASTIHQDDAAIIISYSGSLPIIQRMMNIYKQSGIPLIALTSFGPSDLRHLADVTLTITTKEKMYSKIAGYSNETSIKLLLDVLYSCYFAQNYERNYEHKQNLSKQIESYKSASNSIIEEDEK